MNFGDRVAEAVEGDRPVRQLGEGREVRFAAEVLGDPRVALTWLANELREYGLTLAAGQLVATGSTIVPMPVRAGQTVLAELGVLGSVVVHLD